MGLIGCILYDNRVYERVADVVKAEHFGVEPHGRIFEAVGKLIARGTKADPAVLRDYFAQDDSLSQVGGAAYLGKLASAVVTTINARDYATIIRDCWVRRRIIDIASAAMDDAYEADIDMDAAAKVDALQGELSALGDIGSENYRAIPLGEATNEALDKAAEAEQRGTRINGIRTGFHGIDNMLGGLQAGGLYVLGGRTSQGKSSLARWLAYNVAVAAAKGEPNSGPVIYFSMEMTAAQMGAMIVGPLSGIRTSDLMIGAIGDGWAKLYDTQGTLANLPLIFDDRAGLSVNEIQLAAKRMKRKQGLGLIIIDLLGYLKAPPETSRENKSSRIGEMTKALKRASKALSTPILLLHQLSRETEKREDPRPRMADLADSGSIEQDADVVMFVYRESYYLSRAEPRQKEKETDEAFIGRMADWREDCRRLEHIGEVIVDKNRITGPIGTVKLFWDGQFARFANLNNEDAQERML